MSLSAVDREKSRGNRVTRISDVMSGIVTEEVKGGDGEKGQGGEKKKERTGEIKKNTRHT